MQVLSLFFYTFNDRKLNHFWELDKALCMRIHDSSSLPHTLTFSCGWKKKRLSKRIMKSIPMYFFLSCSFWKQILLFYNTSWPVFPPSTCFSSSQHPLSLPNSFLIFLSYKYQEVKSYAILKIHHNFWVHFFYQWDYLGIFDI